MTLEDVVRAVQDSSDSDPEVVKALAHLFATGRVRRALRASVAAANAA